MATTTRTTTKCAAIMLFVLAACGGGSDLSAPTTTTSGLPTTEPAGTGDAAPSTESGSATTQPVPTTTSPVSEASSDAASDEPEADDPPVDTSPDGIRLLDFELDPVSSGEYRVETIGAPFTIAIPDGWFVQVNSRSHFVITPVDSEGPGDRDIVMIRPSHLADPDDPSAPVEEQSGDWPLGDIDGWLAALVPGVVDGEPTDATLGGLSAVRFDVAITEDVECGRDGCVGFATNRLVNGMWFDRHIGYRTWWIDGGEHSPIAVQIGDGTDPAFTEMAESVLDTVVFESVGPNPVPAEGNLWEIGLAADVPAGTVALPIGPGVVFEISDEYFIVQDDFFSRVLDGPAESDILFTDLAFDDKPIATTTEAIEALERAGLTTEVRGTRIVSGYEATEVDFKRSPPVQDVPLVFLASGSPEPHWFAPPEGTAWIMETEFGVAIITAEAFERGVVDEANAIAEDILDTIIIGG